jgi:hypothetical protein
MKSNLGGRADNWTGHPAGDSTSIAGLKSVPGIVDRVPSTRGGGSGHTPPSTAEFNRIHTQDKTPITRRPIG